MEVLLMVSLGANALVGLVIVGVLASSKNRRIIAAWLATSAQAKDELFAARQGIEREQRIAQRDFEASLLGEKPKQRPHPLLITGNRDSD